VCWCRPFSVVEYLFDVSEGIFTPPPKVKSGVIKLLPLQKEQTSVPNQNFFCW
jgi:16S rRNA (adenine1518-N6/adenine1519-N6)-dimethyltransferase